MSDAHEGGSAADSPPPPAGAAPDLAESIREVGNAAREGLKEVGGATRAFRALLAADVSLARSAFGRAMALTGVAIVFGASCWLLLMATLIVVAILLAVAAFAGWRAQVAYNDIRTALRRDLTNEGIDD